MLTAFPKERAMRTALAKLDMRATIEIIGNQATALWSAAASPPAQAADRA